jgi:hypothetical protein
MMDNSPGFASGPKEKAMSDANGSPAEYDLGLGDSSWNLNQTIWCRLFPNSRGDQENLHYEPNPPLYYSLPAIDCVQKILDGTIASEKGVPLDGDLSGKPKPVTRLDFHLTSWSNIIFDATGVPGLQFRKNGAGVMSQKDHLQRRYFGLVHVFPNGVLSPGVANDDGCQMVFFSARGAGEGITSWDGLNLKFDSTDRFAPGGITIDPDIKNDGGQGLPPGIPGVRQLGDVPAK